MFLQSSLPAHTVVFKAPRKLDIETVIVPPPGPGFVRIHTYACGVCMRELHVYSGRLRREFPTVMGHEPVGQVESVGPGVTGIEVGDWVTGVGERSLAEYSLLEGRFIAPIGNPPQKPEYWLGEPVMCAVGAVHMSQATPTDRVVVNGVGFMGHLLIQALRLHADPIKLVAIDIKPDRSESALRAGAEVVFTVPEATPETILEALGNHADIVFEASGAPSAILTTTRLLRNGGTLCLFAHHFSVENEAVNDWHLRGITVLNTVPWAFPNLSWELRHAVHDLSTRKITLDSLITHIASCEKADKLMEVALLHPPNFIKGVLTF